VDAVYDGVEERGSQTLRVGRDVPYGSGGQDAAGEVEWNREGEQEVTKGSVKGSTTTGL
jgi:hypothetical protein